MPHSLPLWFLVCPLFIFIFFTPLPTAIPWFQHFSLLVLLFVPARSLSEAAPLASRVELVPSEQSGKHRQHRGKHCRGSWGKLGQCLRWAVPSWTVVAFWHCAKIWKMTETSWGKSTCALQTLPSPFIVGLAWWEVAACSAPWAARSAALCPCMGYCESIRARSVFSWKVLVLGDGKSYYLQWEGLWLSWCSCFVWSCSAGVQWNCFRSSCSYSEMVLKLRCSLKENILVLMTVGLLQSEYLLRLSPVSTVICRGCRTTASGPDAMVCSNKGMQGEVFRNKWEIDSVCVCKDSPGLTVTAWIKGSGFCLFRLPGSFFSLSSRLDRQNTIYSDWTEATPGKAPWPGNNYYYYICGLKSWVLWAANFRQFWKGIKVLVSVSSSLTGSGGSRKFVIAAMPAFGGRSLASCSWRPVSVYVIQASRFGQNYRSKI